MLDSVSDPSPRPERLWELIFGFASTFGPQTAPV